MGYKILYNYCTTITVPTSSRDLTHLHTLQCELHVGIYLQSRKLKKVEFYFLNSLNLWLESTSLENSEI